MIVNLLLKIWFRRWNHCNFWSILSRLPHVELLNRLFWSLYSTKSDIKIISALQLFLSHISVCCMFNFAWSILIDEGVIDNGVNFRLHTKKSFTDHPWAVLWTKIEKKENIFWQKTRKNTPILTTFHKIALNTQNGALMVSKTNFNVNYSENHPQKW